MNSGTEEGNGKTPAVSSDESVRTKMKTIIERVQAEFDAQGRTYTPSLEAALNWLNRQRAK